MIVHAVTSRLVLREFRWRHDLNRPAPAIKVIQNTSFWNSLTFHWRNVGKHYSRAKHQVGYNQTQALRTTPVLWCEDKQQCKSVKPGNRFANAQEQKTSVKRGDSTSLYLVSLNKPSYWRADTFLAPCAFLGHCKRWFVKNRNFLVSFLSYPLVGLSGDLRDFDVRPFRVWSKRHDSCRNFVVIRLIGPKTAWVTDICPHNRVGIF